MKTFPIVKTTWLIAIFICFAMLPKTTWAQCPNDNTGINTTPLSIICPGSETLMTGMEAGQFIRVNVESGNEYTFETCDRSDMDFDTEMTIYRDDNGSLIDHNDDDCGTDSRITFTPNFTGVVRILIDSSGCVSGGPQETGILGTCTAPPSCDITATGLSNITCNDNGTPTNPNDDYMIFTLNPTGVNLGATYTATAEVDVPFSGIIPLPLTKLDGSPATNLPYGSPVQLRMAAGTSIPIFGLPISFNVFVTDDDDPACELGQTGTMPQPCSIAPPPCDITATGLSNITCNDNGTPTNPNDDYMIFTLNPTGVSLGTTYTATAEMEIPFVIPIPLSKLDGSPATNLPYGGPVQLRMAAGTSIPNIGLPISFNVFVTDDDDPACELAQTGTMPQPCSIAPPSSCEIIGFSFANIGPCNDNGTPNNDADDFFFVEMGMIYSNSTVNATLFVLGQDVLGGNIGPALVGTNLTHTFVNFKLRADGQITEFIGNIIEPGAGPVICSLPGTGPAVNECSNATPPCSITNITTSNQGPCNDNGTNSNPNDDFFTLNVTVFFANPPATGSLDLSGTDLVPGGGPSSVPVANLSGNSHTFTGIRWKADGQETIIVAVFTANQSCTAGINPGIIVQPCSFPPPVLTCPSAVAVSCASQVPPANPASVSETHTCPGAVTITHIGDVNSNVICINHLTITRTYQGTDQCGKTATCTQTITVNDQTPPTVTCPPNRTVSCASEVPAPFTDGGVAVNENCTGGFGPFPEFVADAVTNQTCANRKTITRTYRAVDACNNIGTCTQTITVNDLTPPTITCAAQTTPIECPAVPVFTPPSATDNCGGTPSITFSDVTVPGLCPGTFTRTRTWTATDACANTATCARSITVRDVTPPPVPANMASTVACPALAIAPVPPLVIDACAGAITPTGPVITNVPNPLTCEGTRTFTFTFTDCSGNSAQWRHVTTVEREPFTIATPNGNATVDCPDDTDAQPTPPVVLSNCGEVLTPVLFNVGAKPGCEGQRQYTFRYTDCEGNFADWLFTYLVEYLDFAIPPSEVENAECPFQAVAPTPPTVFDNCGKQLVPIGPVVTSTDNAQGCEASRSYAWTYQDCEGNTHTWSKTFHFLYSDDFSVFSDETSTVACLAYAVQPFPPTFYDGCGKEIKVALTGFSEDIAPGGCTGWRKFDFTYTDCGGHSHPWSFTYEINDNEAPLGTCPSGNGGTSNGNSPVAVSVTNLSCIEEVPCPDDYDFTEKVEELLVAGNYFDVCSGADLVVELDSYSDLWQCADPDGDGAYTFGRTFYFRIADPCGNEYASLCEVTYSGECLPLETFRQEDWGIFGAMPGNAVNVATTDLSVIGNLLSASSPLTIGGSHRSLTVTQPQCIVDMLPGLGLPAVLANCHQTNCSGPNGASCNPMGIGGMKNSMAANAIALTLNLRYNVQYNGLTMSDLRNQSLGCLEIHECILNCSASICQLRFFDASGSTYQFPFTIGGLLDMANKFLDGGLPMSVGQETIYGTAINQALMNVNNHWNEGQVAAACGTVGNGSQPIAPKGQAPKGQAPKGQAPKGQNDSNTKLPSNAGGAAMGSRGFSHEMSLAPNPATREVVFKLPELDEPQEVTLELFNQLGQCMLRKDFGQVASVSEVVSLDGLEDGLYFAIIKVGARQLGQKLVVSKN
jgi:hypothetical protein